MCNYGQSWSAALAPSLGPSVGRSDDEEQFKFGVDGGTDGLRAEGGRAEGGKGELTSGRQAGRRPG